MYICLCNALSEVQVRRLIRDGARRPRDVHLACGQRAQCGGCTKTILGFIRDDVSVSPSAHESQEP